MRTGSSRELLKKKFGDDPIQERSSPTVFFNEHKDQQNEDNGLFGWHGHSSYYRHTKSWPKKENRPSKIHL